MDRNKRTVASTWTIDRDLLRLASDLLLSIQTTLVLFFHVVVTEKSPTLRNPFSRKRVTSPIPQSSCRKFTYCVLTRAAIPTVHPNFSAWVGATFTRESSKRMAKQLCCVFRHLRVLAIHRKWILQSLLIGFVPLAPLFVSLEFSFDLMRN